MDERERGVRINFPRYSMFQKLIRKNYKLQRDRQAGSPPPDYNNLGSSRQPHSVGTSRQQDPGTVFLLLLLRQRRSLGYSARPPMQLFQGTTARSSTGSSERDLKLLALF